MEHGQLPRLHAGGTLGPFADGPGLASTPTLGSHSFLPSAPHSQHLTNYFPFRVRCILGHSCRQLQISLHTKGGWGEFHEQQSPCFTPKPTTRLPGLLGCLLRLPQKVGPSKLLHNLFANSGCLAVTLWSWGQSLAHSLISNVMFNFP